MANPTLWWILGGGLLMTAVALVGGVTLVLPAAKLERALPSFVALAAGSLLGGAWFHLLPAAYATLGPGLATPAWVAAGFTSFLVLEQFLHWHHCHRAGHDECDALQRRPLGYLILLADGLHNLLGGLAVAGAFIQDVRVGAVTWLAAAAHEVPQELGDFGVLVHSGWKPTRALAWNAASALTFLLGGLLAYAASSTINTAPLLPFAAGNFLYIASADLIPEIKHPTTLRASARNFAAFSLGLGLLAAAALLLET